MQTRLTTHGRQESGSNSVARTAATEGPTGVQGFRMENGLMGGQEDRPKPRLEKQVSNVSKATSASDGSKSTINQTRLDNVDTRPGIQREGVRDAETLESNKGPAAEDAALSALASLRKSSSEVVIIEGTIEGNLEHKPLPVFRESTWPMSVMASSEFRVGDADNFKYQPGVPLSSMEFGPGDSKPETTLSVIHTVS